MRDLGQALVTCSSICNPVVDRATELIIKGACLDMPSLYAHSE